MFSGCVRQTIFDGTKTPLSSLNQVATHNNMRIAAAVELLFKQDLFADHANRRPTIDTAESCIAFRCPPSSACGRTSCVVLSPHRRVRRYSHLYIRLEIWDFRSCSGANLKQQSEVKKCRPLTFSIIKQ
jgi:hypothetical protein